MTLICMASIYMILICMSKMVQLEMMWDVGLSVFAWPSPINFYKTLELSRNSPPHTLPMNNWERETHPRPALCQLRLCSTFPAGARE